MNKRQIDTFTQCIELAEGGEYHFGAKIAAILTVKNTIISVSHNMTKTHPVALKYGKNADAIYLHAEVNCINTALKFFSEEELRRAKTTLYVARIKWNDSSKKVIVPGLALPCSGCMKAIHAFNIKNVVYTVGGSMENIIFAEYKPQNNLQLQHSDTIDTNIHHACA